MLTIGLYWLESFRSALLSPAGPLRGPDRHGLLTPFEAPKYNKLKYTKQSKAPKIKM
jgi:hypothetical protein